MTFHVVTLFPQSFKSYFSSSIIGRAISDGKIIVKFYNPRDYTADKHRRIDRKPYGGGPGMVIEALPIVKVVEAILKDTTPPPTPSPRGRGKGGGAKIIWLTPHGKQFDNKIAEKFTKKVDHLIIVCGRYEGIDERAKKILRAKNYKLETISVGPYTLTGGELPAMVIIDSVARRIEGVLGKNESVEERRVAGRAVYTRPEVIEYSGKNHRVPKVLLSGHHANIDKWKKGPSR